MENASPKYEKPPAAPDKKSTSPTTNGIAAKISRKIAVDKEATGTPKPFLLRQGHSDQFAFAGA